MADNENSSQVLPKFQRRLWQFLTVGAKYAEGPAVEAWWSVWTGRWAWRPTRTVEVYPHWRVFTAFSMHAVGPVRVVRWYWLTLGVARVFTLSEQEKGTV